MNDNEREEYKIKRKRLQDDGLLHQPKNKHGRRFMKAQKVIELYAKKYNER